MTFENAFTRDELIELLDDLAPSISTGTARELIRALLAEMDKPGDVWKDAPEGSTSADVLWFRTPSGGSASGHKRYTRELPKSRARVIAEEETGDYEDSKFHPMINDRRAVDVLESAILKREAELEAGK